eukprot:CAMPEP_0171904970 /NCGR_PEP_ID=MMETSP0993-20121228/4690_1 /TAXON_ID=483369 /ORGANISM="non described non described, Strain CCMP2098" /LENGTH=120 /DNA_ID=CAMNT_0012536171 /DNA_START=18 /DNA_END=377 /DNA_ORIENTATION=+
MIVACNVNTNRKGGDHRARGYANVTANFNQSCTSDSGGTQNSKWAGIAQNDEGRRGRDRLFCGSEDRLFCGGRNRFLRGDWDRLFRGGRYRMLCGRRIRLLRWSMLGYGAPIVNADNGAG